jgi:DNA replication protein DnaC
MGTDGRWGSRPCGCQERKRDDGRLKAARIPKSYWGCTLETYDTDYPGADPSQARALLTARKFCEAYPVDTAGKGILFVGSLGSGKTHLAVAVLRRLIGERGAHGIFCDYGALIKDIQMSYNSSLTLSEFSLLDPILSTEILVLDDIGAQKPSDWVRDNFAHILNTRYNNRLTTIITTNFPDLAAGSGEMTDTERSAREQTLGDRIGDRIRSRLAEMCITIPVKGKDFRQTVKRARFGE